METQSFNAPAEPLLEVFFPVPWEPRYDERMGNGDCWRAGAKRRSHDFGPTKDFEVSDGDLVVESRQSVEWHNVATERSGTT